MPISIELFKSGFNCSQAVLAVFSEELGLSREMALKIALPFGGGIGGSGKICGALSGAIMVIGLKYETSKVTDVENRNLCKEKTRKLIESFENEHGTINCNDLVGFDMNALSGVDLKAKVQHFQNTCPKFLETVVSFLEEEL